MVTKLAVVTLWAEDVLTVVHFYRDVIGLQLMPFHHAGHPHFILGDTYLTILKGQPVAAQNSEPPRFPILAFAVDDLDAAVQRLNAHQVALPWGVEQDSDSRWLMFQDPAGNLIEIAQFE